MRVVLNFVLFSCDIKKMKNIDKKLNRVLQRHHILLHISSLRRYMREK